MDEFVKQLFGQINTTVEQDRKAKFNQGAIELFGIYDSLNKAGFTAEQSMQILTTMLASTMR